MTKSELVDEMSEKAGISKAAAARALQAFTDSISETLMNGKPAHITGFGTFDTVKRQARTGRSPRTGEAIQIPASTAVKFTTGKALKQAVN